MGNDREFKNRIYEQFARVGKAVDSPRRIELLDLLGQAERTVEKLAELTDMSVANTSRHLRILLNARLVEKDKRGVHAWYSLADESVSELVRALRNVAETRLAEVERITQEFFGGESEVERVDRTTLLRRVKDGEAIVIDVRPREEYEAGHLAGAVSIPLDELEERLAELPREQEIVAYCRGPYCVLAAKAVDLLQSHGFRAVRLPEGPPDWKTDAEGASCGTDGEEARAQASPCRNRGRRQDARGSREAES